MEIVSHEFYGRKDELAHLSEILQSKKFQLIRIKGRRRIGKTKLVKHLRETLGMKDDLLFHTPIESDLVTNIQKLYLDSQETNVTLPQVPLNPSTILTYYPLLEKIESLYKGIIIDEYPRLQRACHLAYPKLTKEKNPLDDILKDFKENKSKNLSFKIILLGSEVSIMEELDGGNRPLRGLFNHTIHLKPFNFYELQYFFPNKSFREILEIFGYSDGIPLYLWKLKESNADNFWDWIVYSVVKDPAFWYSEINNIIEADFSITGTRYGAILDAIAKGNTRPNEILGACKLNRTGDITPYLKKLLRSRIIKQEFPISDLYRPVGTSHQRNLKNGVYKLSDNFISFWYRFIKTTEALDPPQIKNFIQAGYSQYLGTVFESVCREFVAMRENYPYIGKWWGKIDGVMEECDILAFDPQQNEALIGICKWTKKDQNPKKLMKQAIRYENHILYNNKERDMKYRYMIFSKNLEYEIDSFEGKEVSCYDETDLNRIMKNFL